MSRLLTSLPTVYPMISPRNRTKASSGSGTFHSESPLIPTDSKGPMHRWEVAFRNSSGLSAPYTME